MSSTCTHLFQNQRRLRFRADVIYVSRRPAGPSSDIDLTPSATVNETPPPNLIVNARENPTPNINLSPLVTSTTTVVAVSHELTPALSSPSPASYSLPFSPPSPPKQMSPPTVPSPREASGEDSSSKGSKCNKCGEYYNDSKGYHDRIRHQSETKIKTSAGKITISRNAESREFTCPLCDRYSSKDPVPFGVHIFHLHVWKRSKKMGWFSLTLGLAPRIQETYESYFETHQEMIQYPGLQLRLLLVPREQCPPLLPIRRLYPQRRQLEHHCKQLVPFVKHHLHLLLRCPRLDQHLSQLCLDHLEQGGQPAHVVLLVTYHRSNLYHRFQQKNGKVETDTYMSG